ncbi:MFS transporter [Actinoplanes regularis]|uniref:Na+/melibiose symporter n=1 Tax=Actinoplanes regularis TaxID=52697 RepID=A0A238W2M9_9ACTN|nr:MFS transporter [Actinoplanes regularis]GIE91980.1 MFS transporter [Actinoplanes regularis]SNR39969.1 Na+/melibiose symporter [Actinoplanes regularis]
MSTTDAYRKSRLSLRDEPRHASPGFLAALTLAHFGMWVALLTPAIAALQLKINAIGPADRETSLSLVLGLGAVLGLLANPVFGHLSDRTTARLGMRRPWLIGGATAALGGLALTGAANSVVTLAIGWCVASLALNALLATMLALLPDQVPAGQRGTASALMAVGQALAAGAGAGIANGLAGTPVAMFAVPGVIALVTVLVLAARLDDRRLDPADRPPLALRELARSFRVDPRRCPDFGWAWVSRFMIFMAIYSVLTYQVFYLDARMGLTEQEATRAILTGVLVQIVAVVASGNLVGWLSDRFGRRRIFVCVSALIAATGLLTLAVAWNMPQFYLAMVLTGLGQGTYFAVDLALVTDVLPNRWADAGKDLGVMNVANTLPQSLAPAIAPPLLAIGGGGNYTMLFLTGALFALLSGLSVLRVKGAR